MTSWHSLAGHVVECRCYKNIVYYKPNSSNNRHLTQYAFAAAVAAVPTLNHPPTFVLIHINPQPPNLTILQSFHDGIRIHQATTAHVDDDTAGAQLVDPAVHTMVMMMGAPHSVLSHSIRVNMGARIPPSSTRLVPN